MCISTGIKAEESTRREEAARLEQEVSYLLHHYHIYTPPPHTHLTAPVHNIHLYYIIQVLAELNEDIDTSDSNKTGSPDMPPDVLVSAGGSHIRDMSDEDDDDAALEAMIAKELGVYIRVLYIWTCIRVCLSEHRYMKICIPLRRRATEH
jgi:hypothetical protein